MARMSSVIYVMHKRVSATGDQANAHLDVLSLNSMRAHYVSPLMRVAAGSAAVKENKSLKKEEKRKRQE